MNFDEAFTKIIEFEGGYVNSPSDPGGETKYGISKRSYPTLDIANLTLDQAKTIYRQDFWDKCDCDKRAIPFDFLIFDCAVNQGPEFAVTIADTATSPVNYQELRFHRYKKSPAYDVYGANWIIRLLRGLELIWVAS